MPNKANEINTATIQTDADKLSSKDEMRNKNRNNFEEKINREENDILHIKNIKKNFGEKKVLEDVTFDLYNNEIFVLLGHNGAGKTTLISILTGLIDSNSGEALYNGYNILSPDTLSIFRKSIGICPQHNILFDNLTVEEHLELFCKFKSISKDEIPKEITKVLKDIGLTEKSQTKACELSGGQKRKLSVGLAIIGKSSLIFLDEPTSGMDITSRRNLWDILKRCTTGKFVVLTTHFMEEASVLGNRIGILSKGKMQCTGTPLELIEKYTNSVNLNITKHYNANNDAIVDYILDKFEGKNIDIDFENFNREILFRISTDKEEIRWSEFFERLDVDKYNLGIKSYSISKSTLEDVFINLGKIMNKKDINKSRNVLDIRSDNSGKNSAILYNQDYCERDIHYCTKFFKDFKISFMKRLKLIIREKKTFILEILCPILLTLIGCLVGYIEVLEENRSFPLKLNQLTNDSQVIYYNYYSYGSSLGSEVYQMFVNNRLSDDFSNIQFENLYTDIFYRNYNPYNILENINELDKVKKYDKRTSFVYYVPLSLDNFNHQYDFNIIVDIKARQAVPIYTSCLLNSVVRFASNRNIEIEMINEPFPYTHEEIKNKKSRNQFLIVFFIALAFSLIPSNFVTILIRERENNSKHLQIISGISLFGYWFNNYFFELVKYYFIGGICLLILLAFDFYEKYFHILYLEYGPAMISFTYIFSIIFKSEFVGQITVLLINLIFGSVFGIAVIIMRIYDKLVKYANRLAYFLRIVPSFCFCYGYNQLIRKYEIFNLDKDIESYEYNFLFTENDVNENIISKTHVGADFIYLPIEIGFYLLLFIILEIVLNNKCCNKNVNLNNEEYKVRSDINLQSSRIESQDKLYAIKVQNLVKSYYNNCCNKINAVRNISFNLDSGEIFGFLGVNGAGKSTTFKCLSHEIFPSYGKIYINGLDITQNFNKVRNLIGYCPQFDAIFDYLTVYENLEFYGLIKGAKKEKLDIIINALIEEINLAEFKNKISGTLSGGNKRKLSVAISLICNPPIILLDEPSAGMDPEARRHMWKAIYNVSLNRKKSTIIMTTHSMEEAESLCKRIGILVEGQFKCLGTSDEIKDKYGYGFEFNLQIKEPEIDELFLKYRIDLDNINVIIDKNSFVECFNKYNLEKYINQFNRELFGSKIIEEVSSRGHIKLNKILLALYYPTCALGIIKLIKEYFNKIKCVYFKDNNFLFQIERNKSIEEKSIGFLFGLIENNKSQFKIGQYSLQYSSLEQIFNKFAMENENINNNIQNKIEIEINQNILDCFS